MLTWWVNKVCLRLGKTVTPNLINGPKTMGFGKWYMTHKSHELQYDSSSFIKVGITPKSQIFAEWPVCCICLVLFYNTSVPNGIPEFSLPYFELRQRRIRKFAGLHAKIYKYAYGVFSRQNFNVRKNNRGAVFKKRSVSDCMKFLSCSQSISQSGKKHILLLSEIC